jgi:alkylhydroperoxidase family enzyme
MEVPITMDINHKSAPELLLPYWIEGLGSWWETASYFDAERAALAYCDTLTKGNQLSFQDIHDSVAKHFFESELAELMAIIPMRFWTRLKSIQGATPKLV